MVAEISGSQQWATHQDVTTTITHLSSDPRATISYVQINVDQTSNLGRAYVAGGGIGQHVIVLYVFAQKTFSFSHYTTIYGY